MRSPGTLYGRRATGGDEALRKCRETRPDVAVLDVMMPGIPGDHVAQAMREDPALCDIPVIFLTALVRKQGAPLDEAYLKGPVAGFYYLAKPFKGTELLEMLGRVLGNS
jgi:CheY-like chemotaxis protein